MINSDKSITGDKPTSFASKKICFNLVKSSYSLEMPKNVEGSSSKKGSRWGRGPIHRTSPSNISISQRDALARLIACREKLANEISGLELEIRIGEGDPDLNTAERGELVEKKDWKVEAELELAVAHTELMVYDEETSPDSDPTRLKYLKNELSIAIKKLKLYTGERINPNNPELDDLRHEIEKEETTREIG
ncbi:hypothetical protein NA56DRAFT_754910 [Hyaloscypha hepaticicola]|uniref:Uncharacterized protein n=1 Tax=Hyaloscypha hepaticicola TaxID=2082293 RepID=A0A2J6PK65_9HELO|nr:hypothetical protein NA56DRAFT_754910 [Hyaloscypha hepaticicola]